MGVYLPQVMQVRRRQTKEIFAMKVLKKEAVFARNDPKDLQHTIAERNVIQIIYIYMKINRERERVDYPRTCTICLYTYICIYIYIYTHIYMRNDPKDQQHTIAERNVRFIYIHLYQEG